MTTARTLRILVGAVAVALFVESLHVLGAKQIFAGVARVGSGFAVILLLAFARDAARAFAWTRAVNPPESLRFLAAFRARLAGEALNTLLPMGMVVGEPMKVSRVSGHIPWSSAFRALAVEFAFYSASLVLLFAAGFAALAVANGVRVSASLVGFVLAATAAILTFVVRR